MQRKNLKLNIRIEIHNETFAYLLDCRAQSSKNLLQKSPIES